MTKEEIQNWIDYRLGVPNTFNIQILIDFQEFVIKKEKQK